MKRKLLYVATFATGMLLTACSNDDNLLDGAKENGLGAIFNEQGNAFFCVNINRPDVAAGSRAAGEDGPTDGTGLDDRNFNNGVSNEYNIENATLLLFGQKASTNNERDYELISYYNLAPEDWEKDDTNAQITQKRTSVVKVSKTNTDGYVGLWALVLANKMNYVSITGDEDSPEITYRNSPNAGDPYVAVSPTKGTKLTYGELADLQIVERHRNYKTSAFFMSNMPYTSAAADGTSPLSVQTLYQVDIAALYTSKETAQTNAAAVTINIERSLAKIEVKKGASFDPETEVEGLTADVKGWFVDNTNPGTSLMRKCFEGTPETPSYDYLNYKTGINDPAPESWSGFRFVSPSNVSAGCHRTFWAIDNYYDEDAPADYLITKKNTVADTELMKFDVEGNVLSGSLREMDSYYYCTENTFDVKHQTENNTTRVVVAATFNNEKDFYTVSTKEGEIFNEKTDMTAEQNLQNYIKDEVVKRSINQAWAEYYLNTPANLKNYLKVTFKYDNAKDANRADATAGKLTAAITLDEAAITAAGDLKTGTIADAVSHWPSDNDEALNGTSYIYNYYKNGAAFYSIKIKHFGNQETPWKGVVGMHNTVPSNYGADGTTENDLKAAKNYLGRYGVVRNSWYNITVTGIRQIGSPTVPDTPNIPDDTVEQYLKYTINVTPWRLYKQSEKLQ